MHACWAIQHTHASYLHYDDHPETIWYGICNCFLSTTVNKMYIIYHNWIFLLFLYTYIYGTSCYTVPGTPYLLLWNQSGRNYKKRQRSFYVYPDATYSSTQIGIYIYWIYRLSQNPELDARTLQNIHTQQKVKVCIPRDLLIKYGVRYHICT